MVYFNKLPSNKIGIELDLNVLDETMLTNNKINYDFLSSAFTNDESQIFIMEFLTLV